MTYGGLPYNRTMIKDKRLELRLAGSQKALIEKAAALSGRSVSDFSSDVLTERAEEVIRHERELRVDAEAFDAFNAILDRPARSIDALADLLQRPSIFVD
jgi:uncharacterized protein (DUF1778 family)